MAWNLSSDENSALLPILGDLNISYKKTGPASTGALHFECDGDSLNRVAEAMPPLTSAVRRAHRIVFGGEARERTFRAWGLTTPPGKSAIMGIINVTPDSFYDGGRYADAERAAAQGEALAREGADLLDVGGESTRPGSAEVTVEEEIARVVPVIGELRRRVNVPISVDTRKSAVAEEAVEAGATVINDVSALAHDPGLARVAAQSGAGLVLNHIRGEPGSMQEDPRYDDVLMEVCDTLIAAAELAMAAGVKEEKIVLDPGIGFGKTADHNLLLIRHLFELRSCGFPILLGPSRKSFLGAVLDLPVEERLEGTLAACAVAVRAGTDIFRVHDVQAVRRAVRVAEAIDSGGG